MSTAERVVHARGLQRLHDDGPVVVTALTGVDLDVHVGELVTVMGPSGSGKSTLLHLLGGLDVPTAGSVSVAGQDLTQMGRKDRARVRRRTVGYVFQDLNLVPSLRAVENASLPLDLDGVHPDEARRQALEALKDVGLADLAERFPAQLSGGQQQRVAIARALVGPRRLLLADEPTGALDSVTGEEIMALLRARVDAGASAVVVTHDARLAAWGDRTVFLRDGAMTDMTRPPTTAEDLLGAEE